MKYLLPLIVIVGLGLVGCNSSDDGDVKAAEAAAKRAPKTAADLPKDMPDAARKQAEAAMAQGQVAKAQMDAQAEAMKKARASGGN